MIAAPFILVALCALLACGAQCGPSVPGPLTGGAHDRCVEVATHNHVDPAVACPDGGVP